MSLTVTDIVIDAPVTIEQINVGQSLSDAQINGLIDDRLSDIIPARGDLLMRGDTAPVRLPVGTPGQVLGVEGEEPAWIDLADATDPTEAIGDMIVRADEGPVRLPVGSDGQILAVDGDTPAWIDTEDILPDDLLTDPTTATGDIIVRGTEGPIALPVGTDGQILSVDGDTPAWIDLPESGLSEAAVNGLIDEALDEADLFDDPMTTAGDLIVRGASAPERLPVGANGKILGVVSSAPAWIDVPGSTGFPLVTVSNTTLVANQSHNGKLIILHAFSSNAILEIGSEFAANAAGHPWQEGAHFYVMASSINNAATISAASISSLRGPAGAGSISINSIDQVYHVIRTDTATWRVISATHPLPSQAIAEAGALTFPHVWSPERIRQAVRALGVQVTAQPYTGAVQDLTTTYADVAGGSITYTRKFSSSRLYVTFNAQMSPGDSAGVAHFKFFAGGTEQAAYRTTHRMATDDIRIQLEAVFDSSASGSIILKWQAREFSASFETSLHNTSLFDGAASVVSSAAVLTVIEIPN